MQPEITLYMCVYRVDSASYDRKLKYVPYDLTEVWRKGVVNATSAPELPVT